MLNEVWKFQVWIKHSNSFSTLRYSFVNSVVSNAAVHLWSQLRGPQHNVRICSQDGATVMSAPVVGTGRFLLSVAGSRGWRALDMGDRRWCDVGGQVWEGETVRSYHPLLASLWAYSRWWREAAVWVGSHGGWRRNCIFSWPSLRGYSRILLDSCDPWKGPVCGIACRRRRCRHVHWYVASHPSTRSLSDTESFQFRSVCDLSSV